ncbi:hypothetical protein IWZ01DRAFT_323266 [Phyllosticta capitalensis]
MWYLAALVAVPCMRPCLLSGKSTHRVCNQKGLSCTIANHSHSLPPPSLCAFRLHGTASLHPSKVCLERSKRSRKRKALAISLPSHPSIPSPCRPSPMPPITYQTHKYNLQKKCHWQEGYHTMKRGIRKWRVRNEESEERSRARQCFYRLPNRPAVCLAC